MPLATSAAGSQRAEPTAFGLITAYYSRLAAGNWEPGNLSTTGLVDCGLRQPQLPVIQFPGSAANGANHTVTVTADNAGVGLSW
jgi:hypothetical protein